MSTRAQILAEIAAQFPDNTSGAITPAKLRQVVGDIADSYNNSTDEPAIAAADITDLASGRGPLLTGTQAQARAAIGAAAVTSLNPGIVLIGSSTFAYEGFNTLAGASATTSSCRGCVANGIALSGARAKILSNLAVISSLVADHDAQFVQAIALAPQIIAVQPFSNDIANGVTAATLYPHLLSWADQCAARGIHLIVRSSHYRSLTSTQMREYMKIRELTRVLALGNQWVHNIDGFSDMQDDASTVGACRENYIVEGLHPSNLGAYVNGRSYAELFKQLLPPLPYHYADAYDAAFAGNQGLRNPTLSITGGTLGAGCTGEVPKDWTLDFSATGSRSDSLTTSALGAIITDTDGRKAFRVTITNGIAGDVLRLWQGSGSVPSPAGFNGVYEAGCIVRYESGTGLAQPEFTSGLARMLMRFPSADQNYPLGESGQTWTLTQNTPAITQGAYVGAYLYITPRSVAASNATIVVKSPYLRYTGT